MSGRKMKFEMAKTFDISRRLSTWIKRSNTDETELVKKEQIVQQRYKEQQERLRKANTDVASDDERKQALGLK